jgi:hypothetical protein
VRERATAKVKTDGYANLAEWLRDVIIAKAEGIHVLRSVAERRISSVSAIVPKKDRER